MKKINPIPAKASTFWKLHPLFSVLSAVDQL